MLKYTPRKYQEKAYNWALNNPKCALFLDMGLGKTAIVLRIISYLMYEDMEIKSTLIVAPKAVADHTWEAESAKWEDFTHLKLSKIMGSQKQRIEAILTPADVYIINVDNLVWLINYFGDKLPYELVIFDESSKFKNDTSQRFKKTKEPIQHVPRVILLSGTPAPNGYKNLWSQLYLLDGGKRLGKTMREYKARYFSVYNPTGKFDVLSIKKGSAEQIQAAISDICMSMKSEDYIELPDLILNDIYLHLPEETLELYNEFANDQIVEFWDNVAEKQIEVTAFHAAALSNKLLQLASGALYTSEDPSPDREYIDIAFANDTIDVKVDALHEIIEAAEGKSVMIAYMYNHTLKRLQEGLKKYKPRVLKDNKDINDWNEGKIQVCLVQPSGKAYGLNLQDGGHILVWFSPTWDLEVYDQFNKRLHRSGQQHTVILHRLIAIGTEEERVVNRLAEKGELQTKLLKELDAKRKQVGK